MGKSQETQQLSVGMSGKWGFGGCRPYYGFFLGRTPQLTAGFFTCRNGHACIGKYVFQRHLILGIAVLGARANHIYAKADVGKLGQAGVNFPEGFFYSMANNIFFNVLNILGGQELQFNG
jgi:hypothetical protein